MDSKAEKVVVLDPKFEIMQKKYSNYKNWLKFLLLTGGAWADEKAQSGFARMFFRAFASFIGLSVCVFITNFLKKEGNHNFNLYMRGVGYMIGFWSIFMKVFILSVHQNKLKHLDKNISALFERDFADPKTYKYASKHFLNISNLCWSSSWFMLGAIIFLVSNMAYYASKGIYMRLYSTRLPFDIEAGSTVYWVSFTYDFLQVFYIGSITLGADNIFGYYALHVIGELCVLREEFLDLKPGPNYKKNISACIKKHLMILESLHILEKIFGFLAIWLALTCQIVICAIIYQVSLMDTMTLGRALSLISHCGVKINQSFSYAYYGYAINLESEKCLQAVYDSHWPGSKKDQRQDALIILSQKPMIFNAYNIMFLGFDMFAKTLNASLSYYMMIRTLDAKKT